MKITKAIIPAAGLGTRVLPASKAVPKEMLNIVDKPAIQYIVEEAVAAGITDILIVTNRGKGVIEDHFDHSFELETKLKGNPAKAKILESVEACANLANIYYIRQKETKGPVTRCFAPRALSATSRSRLCTVTTLSSRKTRLSVSFAALMKNTAAALSA